MRKRGKFSFGMFLLLIVFIYLSYIAVGQQKLIDTKTIENTRVENKIKEEQKVNEELKEEKKTIKSDKYVEKVARDKLGMVKKNERVFVDIGK